MIESPPTFTPRDRPPRRAGVPGYAWTLAGAGGSIGVLLLFGALHYYDLPFVIQHLPEGIPFAVVSLEVTCLAFAIGFGVAIVLGVVRAFPPTRSASGPVRRPWLRSLRYPSYGVVSGFVAAVRGTPFLVQMFLIFFLVIFAYPQYELFGLRANFWAGLIALTINTAGYQTEAFRGGFQSVDASQVEAAKALGLGPLSVFVRITLPQGLRLIVLPLTNEWISTFKTSTILSYISFNELFYWGHLDIAGRLAQPVEGFLLIAIFYLAINVTLSRSVAFLEERYRIPGLGSVTPEAIARTG